jgi:hypothetical protein
MKKSLSEAIERAKQDSVNHANIIFTVMDKKGKTAITTSSDWIYRERILAGYYTVIRFLNGQEVK